MAISTNKIIITAKCCFQFAALHNKRQYAYNAKCKAPELLMLNILPNIAKPKAIGSETSYLFENVSISDFQVLSRYINQKIAAI